MSQSQELEGIMSRIPLEERALMALYLHENESANILDLIYSKEWHQNYLEWVEWKQGKRKDFKMKKRHWTYHRKRDDYTFDYYNPERLKDRVYIDQIPPEQTMKVGDDCFTITRMKDGDEVDLGYAKVSFRLDNRKRKHPFRFKRSKETGRGKWTTRRGSEPRGRLRLRKI